MVLFTNKKKMAAVSIAAQPVPAGRRQCRTSSSVSIPTLTETLLAMQFLWSLDTVFVFFCLMSKNGNCAYCRVSSQPVSTSTGRAHSPHLFPNFFFLFTVGIRGLQCLNGYISLLLTTALHRSCKIKFSKYKSIILK
jgi:hypothetical protein